MLEQLKQAVASRRDEMPELTASLVAIDTENPPGRDYATVLREAIAAVHGEPAPFELCHGIVEIRFYAERGAPAFAYGPGLLAVAHGSKEFIKRRDLENVATVYALTAARLLSK